MKRLILMAAMACCTLGLFGVEESYLFWQVKPINDEWTLRPFDYAVLTVTDQGGTKIAALNTYDYYGDGPYIGSPSDPDGRTATYDYAYNGLGVREGSVDSIPALSDITGYASEYYGFVVEAYLDGTLAWHSGVYFYEQVMNSVWNGTASDMNPSISPFSMQVPEPTSAMMLLLGLGALALKRKVA